MTTKIQPGNIDSVYDYSPLVVSAYQTTNVAFGTANSAALYANAAFLAANNASDSWVRNQANAAFTRANNSLNVQSGGTITGNISLAGNFVPASNITYNLGSTTLRWKDLYLSGNTIDLAGAQIKSDPNTGGFVFVPTPNANTPNPTALFISSTGTLTTVQTTAGVISTANLTLAASNTANTVPTDVSINLAFAQANAAFVQANAAYTAANNASDSWVRNQANSSFTQANAAYTQANSEPKAVTAGSYANAAFIQANAAFTKANTAITTSGGTITGSLTISQDAIIQGNLNVLGSTTSINTSSFTVNDSLLVLGLGNYTSDALDIGFASHYNAGTNAHTGLIRDSDTKSWMFFEGYTPEVTPNNNVVITDPSFSYANVRARTVTGNLIANTVTVNGVDLYNYTTNAYTQANNEPKAVTAGSYANAAFIQANAAFTKANTPSGITYTAANTAPTSPKVGDQWYIISSDILYEYINDGTSNNWVDITSPTITSASSGSGASSAVIVGYNLVFGG